MKTTLASFCLMVRGRPLDRVDLIVKMPGLAFLMLRLRG
jgi:hypothetical protein